MVIHYCFDRNFSKMVRKYKPKKEKINKEKLKAAVISVLRDKMSYNAAAKLHGVHKSTVRRWANQSTSEQAQSGSIVERNAGHKTVSIFNIPNNYFEK